MKTHEQRFYEFLKFIETLLKDRETFVINEARIGTQNKKEVINIQAEMSTLSNIITNLKSSKKKHEEEICKQKTLLNVRSLFDTDLIKS